MMSRYGSRFALLLGLGLLTGCYSFHPWGTHPGMMSPNGYPPMQVPQQTFVMPGDTVGSPSTSGVPAARPQSTFIPDSRLEAPEPGTSSGSGNPVPAPREPGEGSAEAPTPAARETSQYGFGLPANSGQAVAAGQPDILQFEEPVVLQQATPRDGVVSVSLEDPFTDPETAGFDYDDKHRWFQGMAEYDAQNRTWHLLYDLNPHVHDQLGGEIQLAGNVPADASYSGKLLRVSGEFDYDLPLDQLSKPVYRVQRIEEVVRTAGR